MALFAQKIRFYREDGSFDDSKFMELLKKSRADLNKTKSGKNKRVRAATQPILIGGVKPKEVWAFVNKLSSFLSSGIDLKTAFAIISGQIPNPKLARIISEVRENLDHGLSVSDTLKMHAKYFDPLVIALIEVGEKTGTLPRVTADLERTLLENIEIKAKIKGAMIYPAILFTLAVSMAAFMLTFVLPKITGVFEKSGVQVPALTQFMIDLSKFMISNWVGILAAIFALIFAFSAFARTYAGQNALGYVSLRIPVFGFINRQLNVILFINSLNLLLESGVLMLEALETAADVVPNLHYKKDIIRIKNEVETGISLSAAMGLTVQSDGKKETHFDNPFFPIDLVHMVGVGEETGTVGKTIFKVGENYSRELRRYIANIMAALEPFIIIFIGAIIGTIIISIMLPFFKLGEVAKKV